MEQRRRKRGAREQTFSRQGRCGVQCWLVVTLASTALRSGMQPAWAYLSQGRNYAAQHQASRLLALDGNLQRRLSQLHPSGVAEPPGQRRRQQAHVHLGQAARAGVSEDGERPGGAEAAWEVALRRLEEGGSSDEVPGAPLGGDGFVPVLQLPEGREESGRDEVRAR